MDVKKSVLSWDWLFHVPVWLAWILIMNTGTANGFGYYSQTSINILGPLILNTSLNIVYFYANAWYFLPRFYPLRFGIRYFYILFLFPFIFLLLKTFAEKLYIFLFIPHLGSITIGELIVENLYSLPFFVLFSLLYFRLRKNKEEKAWLTREKTQKELALLRAQLSPHFLFNTLNNLYSLGMQGRNEEVNAGILKLSEILRYILYDSQSEQVPLKQELSYIHDFIEISKLMFRKDQLVNIKFSRAGVWDGLCIHPMILLTFVENAFKFGQGNNCEPDIEVLAEIKAGCLHFRVKNKVCRKLKPSPATAPGLGLKNTSRQLELLYPDRHELEIKEQGGYFSVDLKIGLKS